MHGYGEFTWPDGKSYEGQYVEDEKQGKGRFNYGDGSYYEGDWYKGRQHGRGKFKNKSGKIYEGRYEYGELKVWTKIVNNFAVDQNIDSRFGKIVILWGSSLYFVGIIHNEFN